MPTRTKKKLELPMVKGYTFDEKNHVHALNGKPLTGVTTVLSVIAKPMLIQWAANQAVDYIVATAEKRHGDFYEDKEVLYQILRTNELHLKEARTAHRKKKEAAGEAGTEVHEIIENFIKSAIEKYDGYISDVDDVIQNAIPQISHFMKWASENKVKFLASEKNVWSEKMWVGGICDIICEIDGKRYVGDIKTSSGIYPEHFIQASAYAEMLKEMGEYKEREVDLGGGYSKTEPAFDGVIIINLKKDGTFDYQYNYDLDGNFNCFKSALTLYKHLNQLK